MTRLIKAFVFALVVLSASVAQAQTVSDAKTFTAADQALILQIRGTAHGTVYLKGVGSGTYSFFGCVAACGNVNNWFAVYGTPKGGGDPVSTASADGAWTFSEAIDSFQVYSTAQASGTPTVQIIFTASGGSSGSGGGVTGTVSIDGTVTVSDGALVTDSPPASDALGKVVRTVGPTEIVSTTADEVTAFVKGAAKGATAAANQTCHSFDADETSCSVTVPHAIESIPRSDAESSLGADICQVISTASTNAFNCKNAEGNAYVIHATNTSATTAGYVRIYDSGSAPTCSSATNYKYSIPILPESSNGRVIPVGEGFDNGISGCITGGGSSTDNTNAPAGIYLQIDYK